MKNIYSGKSKMVKKGTVAKVSDIGHYNFYYPNMSKECVFLSDAIITKPCWMSQNNLVPVKVAGGFLTGPEYKGDKIYVVWVKPTDIECY